ncbi:MAG: WD40 repeat domain-containing protein, partial [Chloroflexota bacterium]
VLKRAFIPDLGQTPWLATAPLREFLRQVSEVLGPQTALYIILDQAEELFTQLEAEGRAEFVAELADCVNDESLPVRWLLSMRTEFFGNLANFRPPIQDPFANDYRLNRLNRAEASEVITEPAKRRGIAFEDGLVEQLLNDLSTGADELPPPQIQLVCSGLFDNLPDGQTSITRAQYDAAGGATGILREHLARVLGRDLKPAQRPIAQRLFESLITAEGRRAVRTQAELLADFKAGQLKDLPPETVQAVLNQLVDSRLLRALEQEVNPTQSGQAYELASGLSPEMTATLTYELAHDYLLDQIKLDPEAQARKAAQELLEQETRTYERYQTLLSPERLAVIAPHHTALRLTPLAEELLAKSEAEVQREQREEEARRQRELEDARKLAESEKRRAEEQAQSVTRMQTRNRIITVVGGLALVAAVVAGILGVISNQNATEAQRQSRISTARELAAAALNNLEVDQERSLLLALQAVTTTYTVDNKTVLPEAEDALHQAVQESRLRLTLTGHTGAAWGIAFSPDGLRLATTSADGTAKVWDVATGRELLTLTGHTDTVWGIAFSSDGQRLATASADKTAKVWEAATGQELLTLKGHTGGVGGLAFSPDGLRLATASDDKTA